MAKQTFIAVFQNKNGDRKGYDFFRFGCKKIDTVLKYLRGYIPQSESCKFLYECFWNEDFECSIYETDYETNADNLRMRFPISELHNKA